MPEGLPNLYVQLDTVKIRPKMKSVPDASGDGTVLVAVGKPQQVSPLWHKVVKFEDETPPGAQGAKEGGTRTIYTGCGLTNLQDLALDDRAPWQLTELTIEPYTARCSEPGCFGKSKKQKK